MLITGGAQKQQDNSYKYGCLNVDGTDGVGGQTEIPYKSSDCIKGFTPELY